MGRNIIETLAEVFLANKRKCLGSKKMNIWPQCLTEMSILFTKDNAEMSITTLASENRRG